MYIKDVLQELGRQMGLDGVKLDDNGVCRLIFDGKIVVDIEAPAAEKGTVYMYAAVCPLPAEGKEALYGTLLEANLFGRGTGGAAFAIDTEMAEVLLYQSFDMEKVEVQEFKESLQHFAAHVGGWMEKLGGAEASGPMGQAPSRGHIPPKTEGIIRA